MWLQVHSNADVEALASFVKVKRTRIVLRQHARLQEVIFIRCQGATFFGFLRASATVVWPVFRGLWGNP